MLNSNYRPLCGVPLPYKERQHYMHSFDLSSPKMPLGFEDYLLPVAMLCAAAGAYQGTAYMTVDEKVVQAGTSQRRPKPHVDGVFIPNLLHRDGKSIGDWGGTSDRGWNHGCNNIGIGPVRRMPVIVASSVVGCRVWKGEFDAVPGEDGDLSGLELDEGEMLPPNIGYLLSPDCVHESMIQPMAVPRTFLRIALPTNFQF